MFNFISWMGCGSNQSQQLARNEIDRDFMRDIGTIEKTKSKLEIPLMVPAPKKEIVPEPKPVAFLTNMTGLVFSVNNTDSAKKKYVELLFNGPSPNDKPGVLFICRSIGIDDYFNIFVKNEASSMIRDDLMVLQKIPVKRADYAVSLVYMFFNYCQKTRKYFEDNTIKEDKNWYNPPHSIPEDRFRLLIQKICEAVNEHNILVNEAWPDNIKYRELTSPKKDIRLEFLNSDDEENKKK